MSRGTRAQLVCIMAILWMASARNAHAVLGCPGMQVPDPTCDEATPNPCTLDCRNPTSGMCGSTHPPLAAGTTCGTPGVCENQDTCDGAGTCVDGGFKPSSTVCRAASGACDVAETCTGNSAACPNDAVASSATVCRPAAANCDVAETCDGTACTTDQCNGTSNTCQHAAGNMGAVCRASAGTCDVAETCTGSSTTCPA